MFEEHIEAVLTTLRGEMALEGVFVRLLRIVGEEVFLEVSGPCPVYWTFAVTAALRSRLPNLCVTIGFSPATPKMGGGRTGG